MFYVFSEQFKEDIGKLKRENSNFPNKVLDLIFDIDSRHFMNTLDGIGKPEYLKGNMSGYMSRRITDKHRLIYQVENDILYLISCYGHYDA